jgi:hypothetical protein
MSLPFFYFGLFCGFNVLLIEFGAIKSWSDDVPDA